MFQLRDGGEEGADARLRDLPQGHWALPGDLIQGPCLVSLYLLALTCPMHWAGSRTSMAPFRNFPSFLSLEPTWDGHCSSLPGFPPLSQALSSSMSSSLAKRGKDSMPTFVQKRDDMVLVIT